MNSSLRNQIEAIHASPVQIVVALTGGGATAIGELLAVPGASRTVLEAVVPYCDVALADWIGGQSEQACSESTARAMAMAAYGRARTLVATDDGNTMAGIGATAALATDRPKQGPHRVHVAWQTASATSSLSLELEKGARDRAAEEGMACQLVLWAVAEASGVTTPREPTMGLPLRSGEQIVHRHVEAPPEWQALLAGDRDMVLSEGIAAGDPLALFPGAFRPLHQGHLAMAQVAERMLGGRVLFELSIANVDKRPLDFVEIDQRVRQFGDRPVLLTRAPTFVEKARLRPGVTFVVGADTITRIGDMKYYAEDARQRDAAIDELAQLGCRFLVFGRTEGSNFRSLRALDLPASLASLCEEVPEPEFRNDISSTKLRGEAGR